MIKSLVAKDLRLSPLFPEVGVSCFGKDLFILRIASFCIKDLTLRKLLIHSACAMLILIALTLGVMQDLRNQQARSHRIDSEIKTKHKEREYAQKTSKQSEELKNLQDVVSSQALAIDDLKYLLSEALGQEYSGQPINSLVVTATAYTAREEECNSQPWVTASGTPSRVGAIAVSRDLEDRGVKLGDVVIIKGMGSFRVEDRMNKRWQNKIDILHANLEAAKIFAKRDVELMWLDRSELASL